MRGIMLARSKPVKLIEPVAIDPLTEILEFEKPKPRAACKFVDAENPAQLLDLLLNEAKVI
jgi:electron transfer flavoprotein beta subunit